LLEKEKEGEKKGNGNEALLVLNCHSGAEEGGRVLALGGMRRAGKGGPGCAVGSGQRGRDRRGPTAAGTDGAACVRGAVRMGATAADRRAGLKFKSIQNLIQTN
jgi:hypothetical protein